VIAVKGCFTSGQPILGQADRRGVNIRGERFKRGAKLWLVGTDTAKHLIYGRLRSTSRARASCISRRSCRSSTSSSSRRERLVTRYVRGRPKMEWVKPAGKRNEALDLDVYNEAAAQLLGLHRMKLADWERRAAELNPAQLDLLRGAGAESRAGARTTVDPRRSRGAIRNPTG
jgi:phage terminase large subunit GpA-like protein